MRSFIISSLLSSFLLFGCSTNLPEIDHTLNVISEENSDWEVEISHSVFSSKDEVTNKSCEVLNKEIDLFIKDREASIKQDAKDLFSNLSSDMERPMWKYSLNISDSIFTTDNGIISVRLTIYTFTGGAHGMTQFHSYNYDLNNQRFLESKDILNQSNEDAIDLLLKDNFHNSEKCFDGIPSLDKASVINISPTSVCFTYEQYTLGAYVCGIAEVDVPKKELGDSFLLRK